MKFGQEYQRFFANEDFSDEWRDSAIDYKNLKKCIKKVRGELKSIGLDAETIGRLSEWIDIPPPPAGEHGAQESKGYYSAAEPSLDTVLEEFVPQLKVLVDSRTGRPLDAALTPATRASLQKLAKHEMILSGRRTHMGGAVQPPAPARRDSDGGDVDSPDSPTQDARWVQLPLASARDFFDLLEPKLEELDALRTAETKKLEDDILDLGDAVENVIEPVKNGFEAKRSMSYRDLYFWREMFRLYMEKPIFYSTTEARRGALTFSEAKGRLQDYDAQLRTSGLMDKMKTPQARKAAQQFLDVNVEILKVMHFQEMNARAMSKILKKFDKRTQIEGQLFLKTLSARYPALLTNNTTLPKNSAGGFANSIARDLSAEISSKVLAIIPQLDDWSCPVCAEMAWKPVGLRCCRSVFCIQCIIKLQERGMKRCPVCNQETVMAADAYNVSLEAMDFLQKYFPMETKKRQKENEHAQLVRTYGNDFVKPACAMM